VTSIEDAVTPGAHSAEAHFSLHTTATNKFGASGCPLQADGRSRKDADDADEDIESHERCTFRKEVAVGCHIGWGNPPGHRAPRVGG